MGFRNFVMQDLKAARANIKAPTNVAHRVANNRVIGSVGKVAGRSSGAARATGRGLGRAARNPYVQGAAFGGAVIGAGYAGYTHGSGSMSVADRSNGIFGGL